MNALEFAAACSSIAGLLLQFRSERGGQTAETLDEYLEWLRRQNHQELVDLINRHAGQLDDEQFVDDDLETLCSLDLLRRDYTSSGAPIYFITRVGAALGR